MRRNSGFTFIEVMVALVVLSAGIVFVYKSFFLCLDYISRLSARLQASQMVDAKIGDITRAFREHGDTAAFSSGPQTITQDINRKRIDFLYQVQFEAVPGFEGLYHLSVGVSWIDAGRKARFMRSILVGT